MSEVIGELNIAITQRFGLGKFEAAQRFYQAVDEVGDFLRHQTQMTEFVSLHSHMRKFVKRVEELAILFQTT